MLPPMSQPPSSSGLSQLIQKQLSSPLKLRLVLCITAIVVWQALFFGPLGEQVTATTARIGLERKRAATAREVERLKKSLAPHRELVGSADADVHELIRHVMDRLRSSPLRLVNLKPEKPKDLGLVSGDRPPVEPRGGLCRHRSVPRLGRDQQAADADRRDPAHAQLTRAGASLGQHLPAGPGRERHRGGEDQGRARKDTMNASRLIKLAPNAILVAYLGYASFSLQSALPGAAAEQAALEKGFDLMLQDFAASEMGAGATLRQIRNPFLVVVPPAEPAAADEPDSSAEPESDKLAAIVAGLTLDATFIQGRRPARDHQRPNLPQGPEPGAIGRPR